MKQHLLLASILALFVSSQAIAEFPAFPELDPDQPVDEQVDEQDEPACDAVKPVFVEGSKVTCSVSVGYYDEKSDTGLDAGAKATAESLEKAIKAAETKACETMLKTKNKADIKKCTANLSYEGVSCNIGGVDVDCFNRCNPCEILAD